MDIEIVYKDDDIIITESDKDSREYVIYKGGKEFVRFYIDSFDFNLIFYKGEDNDKK